jgi:outer membrane protein TolC
MAVEYVALDRLRDRRELNQVSDLDVLEQEAAFQRARTLRTQSQNHQRQTRARLAFALNRPGELPSSVVPPELPQLGQQLPEVDQLQMLALKDNPRLKALREQLEASLALIENARAGNNPSLSGRLEAGNYSREREQTRYGEWRAELSIKVPLYDGNRTDAGVAREKARMFETRSRLSKAELDVRQQVLDLWLRLDTLKAEREQRQTEKSYRELYLDRSRALYETEFKTDLGDSMVRYTEAERNMIESDFEMALTWARLNALLGQLDLDKPFAPPQNLLQKDESNEQAQ